MRISDWSSDVCSSDLAHVCFDGRRGGQGVAGQVVHELDVDVARGPVDDQAGTLGRAGDLLAETEVTTRLRETTLGGRILAQRNPLGFLVCSLAHITYPSFRPCGGSAHPRNARPYPCTGPDDEIGRTSGRERVCQ